MATAAATKAAESEINLEGDDEQGGGRYTLTAARPFIRNHELVKPGQRLVFEHGESEHVVDLMRQGLIVEAPEAVARYRRRVAAMEEERTVVVRDADNNVIGEETLPSLMEPSYEQRLKRDKIQLGQTVVARDKRERRDALSELVEAMRAAGLVGQAAGAQAPGSAR